MPLSSNPQSGSTSSSSSGSMSRNKKTLPPLFWYMEMGDWQKATERAKRHPKEVRTWATLRTKSMADARVSGTKRLALHHACFKLRSMVPNARTASSQEDSFVEVCNFITLMIDMYPEAAGMRESRHGCLPLHLAAFASCAPRAKEDEQLPSPKIPRPMSISSTDPKIQSIGSNGSGGPSLSRPHPIDRRSNSESTQETFNTKETNMSEIFAEEHFTGTQTCAMSPKPRTLTPAQADGWSGMITPAISVARKSNILISGKREDMAVKVINALLDAYPKAIRVDSEGGRLPLHTACAGRATPRVISTLITAYPAAARHRNKDGFLPLHLAAHWGVSHPNVAVALLKAYPDSTLGRNRWERTPLEEALCMAGENGRPHQAALVRSLRKHPSYWTKPPEELFRTESTGRHGSPTLVDLDGTLPDDESSVDEEEERRYFNSGHTKLLEEESSEDQNGLLHRLSPKLLKARKDMLPVHHMLGLSTLIKNKNWPVVLARLEQYPHEAGETVTAMTRGGFIAAGGLTPLHYALERRPPIEVVDALIAAWPESVSTRLQPGGALPLHIACTWHASENVVAAVCRAEPAACRIPDDLGNIPLHCAAFSGAPPQVVNMLLSTYSKSVMARNHQGSLPGDIVKRLRHDNRRAVMMHLNEKKEEIQFNHQRGPSSGSCGAVAQRALELNQQIGIVSKAVPQEEQRLTDGDEGQDDVYEAGIEVTYEEADEKEENELVWI